ncbi:uncharacterized protein BJX67DRAFT_348777 [Aspergillus lucknowensis]|uniref:Uncharacterized protein n=1 Tax=Aspergillus lucknowensis TaxID=176173 RepID=A0ABR4LX30_9EURO
MPRAVSVRSSSPNGLWRIHLLRLMSAHPNSRAEARALIRSATPTSFLPSHRDQESEASLSLARIATNDEAFQERDPCRWLSANQPIANGGRIGRAVAQSLRNGLIRCSARRSVFMCRTRKSSDRAGIGNSSSFPVGILFSSDITTLIELRGRDYGPRPYLYLL